MAFGKTMAPKTGVTIETRRHARHTLRSMQLIASETHIWHTTCRDVEPLGDQAKASHCSETLEICAQRINTAIQTLSTTTGALTAATRSTAPAPDLHTWKWKGDVYVHPCGRRLDLKQRREMIQAHSWAQEVKGPAVVLVTLSCRSEWTHSVL